MTLALNLSMIDVLLNPWTDETQLPYIPYNGIHASTPKVRAILCYDLPYACETCQRLGRHCSRMHWATPCAACLVSGECCCTFTLRIPFMTAVCAFYGVALHGPPLRIPEADATVREALAFFEESVGKSERYQSQGLLDVLYGVPYPSPEILASRLNLAYRLPSVVSLNN
ncbi:hypothetical protein DFH07DRAFT_778973 [Mycena maculata]|uniref:Uncharacterized protein n=1 Tax=Mycena maculata TaxID=230809 RepID=A0AAD7IAX4_9AGAR|nr:hypothetical protein DFH07DRAFT_778973 [Mycena maculata]